MASHYASVHVNDLLQLGPDSTKYVHVFEIMNKFYIHITVFHHSKTEEGMMTPMFTGIYLSVIQWNNLMAHVNTIDSQLNVHSHILYCNDFAPIKLSDETNTFVSVFLWRGVMKLAIRAFRKNSTNIEDFVNGITITQTEWENMKDIAFKVHIKMFHKQMKRYGQTCRRVNDATTPLFLRDEFSERLADARTLKRQKMKKNSEHKLPECKTCKKPFSHSYTLKRHVCKGPVVKKFKTCNICGHYFRRLGNLRRHMKGGCPWSAKFKSSENTRLGNLRRHKSSDENKCEKVQSTEGAQKQQIEDGFYEQMR